MPDEAALKAWPLEVETRLALIEIIERAESPDADVLERLRASLAKRFLNTVALLEAVRSKEL